MRDIEVALAAVEGDDRSLYARIGARERATGYAPRSRCKRHGRWPKRPAA